MSSQSVRVRSPLASEPLERPASLELAADEQPFVMPFQPGELLVGKYEVNDLVGTGGIAFVVSALHTGLDNFVALKFLRPEFARHEEALRRFTDEARNNFKLKSEHVVRVLDVDTLPNGAPFMVMELL